MAKAVKLEDIAKKLGVSNVTVSKALADKSGVSEELRKQIKELARQMGYIPISAQKAKEKKGTGNIGVLIPSQFIGNNSSFYWEIYQSIVTKLQAKGYCTILEILDFEDEEACKLPKMMQDDKIDGLIMLGQVSARYSAYIWENKLVPVVFLDFYDNHMEYDTIISDGFYGMYVLTNYLIQMGHREVGFVGTLLTTSSITDRYFGYQKALLENNITFNKEWLIDDRDMDNKRIELVLPEKLPTAFACNSDLTANILMGKLLERGISVPEDISIVGFDNYLYPNTSNNQITTYEVEMNKMAELGVKTLLRKINHKEYIRGVQIVTGHMVIKNTVKERIE
ncbi:MAG: substrate-binding domain-containing protein [Cellulosilyticum sp.]|nr:substrate-binding domain-containing protein [Cellulosilyticum sp.]